MNEPKERPIIFTGESVRAILDGRKTMTRRVLKPQPGLTPSGLWNWDGHVFGKVRHENGGETEYPPPQEMYCYQPGDRLWVRETMWISDCRRYFARSYESASGLYYDVLDRETQREWKGPRYAPTGSNDTDRRYTHPEFRYMVTSWSNHGVPKKNGTWTEAFELGFGDYDQSMAIQPFMGNTCRASYTAMFRRRWQSIHMPRWASRITLEVTAVRVERVQDITDEDVVAEGVEQRQIDKWREWLHPGDVHGEAFSELWNSINAKRGYGWDENPWVWIIEFSKQ